MLVNAQKIKAHRVKLDWTQQQLADACSVNIRTIQRVERYGKASVETTMALASVFEIDKRVISEDETTVEGIEGTKGNRFKLIYSLTLGVAVIFGMVMGALIMNFIKA